MPDFDPNILPFRKPGPGWKVPTEPGFFQPELMAIGDSLFNGMRSASIDAPRSAQSVPARVATGLGATFRHQVYPEPVLIDLEKEMALQHDQILPLVRLLLKFPAILGGVRDNGRRWLTRCLGPGGATQRFFDNQAVAGADAWDVFNATPRTRRRTLEALAPSVNATNDPLRWKATLDNNKLGLIDLHMAINAKFTLDPDGDPSLAEMRTIDMVQLRKPACLLVSLGANHGTITTTLAGKWREGIRTLTRFADEIWPTCAKALAALDPAIARIVVTLLPLPRLVPNLMPPYQPAGGKPPLRSDGYFPEYENRIGGVSDFVLLAGDTVRQLDADIRGINDRMRAAAATAFSAHQERLVVIDPNDAVMEFDGKHHPQKALKVPKLLSVHNRDMFYTNDAIDILTPDLVFVPEAIAGGIGSLDNHHLSAPGYIAYANTILIALGRPVLPVTDRDDRVLKDLPDPWFAAMHALYGIRRSRGGYAAMSPAWPVAQALQSMNESQHQSLDNLFELTSRSLRLG